ncbi:MAG: UDP-N-acetylmuramate--L-alanine ligase [Pseudomonadota bacterium]
MQLPLEIGPFHIIGIGGIGMSAIAEVMQARGLMVQGSDMKESANTLRLSEKGITTYIGHARENIENAKYVVVSTAIKKDNPEYAAALERKLPIIRRAEMLAEIMRNKNTISVTGTHGKTTTTSLVATVLEEGGLDPTVINGGVLNRWGSNARIGDSEWMVVEADESDGTFLKLPTQIGIVTNIDPEHLDFYGSTENMQKAFQGFFDNIPFYGLAIAGIDHPVVRQMVEHVRGQGAAKRIITYGIAADADIRLENLRHHGTSCVFDIVCGGKMNGHSGVKMENIVLSAPGHHNALNATAAIAVAIETGVKEDAIRNALQEFSGVKRRFSYAGHWNGASFYDDYAHHPVEINSILAAAKEVSEGRVIAVMQPHRYSRLQNLFDGFCTCFKDADSVIVTPVFAAGEKPSAQFGQEQLLQGIKTKGHTSVIGVQSYDHLAQMLKQNVMPGDLVIGLGAGSISEWMHALPDQLTSLETQELPRNIEVSV